MRSHEPKKAKKQREVGNDGIKKNDLIFCARTENGLSRDV